MTVAPLSLVFAGLSETGAADSHLPADVSCVHSYVGAYLVVAAVAIASAAVLGRWRQGA